jgi:hypothetical protein
VSLLIAAVLLDLAGKFVGPSRQVNRSWWNATNPEIASMVWGVELGFGFITRWPGLGIVVLSSLAWLLDEPLAAVVGAVTFGLTRGLQPLLFGLRPRLAILRMDGPVYRPVQLGLVIVSPLLVVVAVRS